MGSGKPRGINAARKLRQHRRDTKWAVVLKETVKMLDADAMQTD